MTPPSSTYRQTGGTETIPADGYDPGEDGRRCYDLARQTQRAALLKSREGQPLTVELPWPPRALHPNARVHWAVKARAVKAARRDGQWAAMAAGIRNLQAGALNVTAVFHPPDNRRRDEDGMLSSCKAYFDGIADICGVDDGRWHIVPRRAEPVKGGMVVVEIEVADIWQPIGDAAQRVVDDVAKRMRDDDR